MAIEWNEKLATGNSNIDDQHKELFCRFDTLLAACNQRKGKDEVHNLLLFLGDYVKTHFSMEEAKKRTTIPTIPPIRKNTTASSRSARNWRGSSSRKGPLSHW